MVSFYSLRPVYIFLYIIINCNVIVSFVQKRKRFEILWSKNKFFCVRTQPSNPLPSMYTIVRIWLDPSPPSLCIRTMWMALTEPILDSKGMGAIFGAHLSEKRAFCLLAPPKLMPFSTISNKNIFFKANGNKHT